MKHLALILALIATPALATTKEEAIMLKAGDFICTTPEDAMMGFKDCIDLEKEGLYVVERLIKSKDILEVLRCVRPIDSRDKCLWLARYE